ncbi:o-succinylbenzoate--CoA ligase [Rhodococcus sp. 15-725-2-2b]|jgi:fatty-acyl-CoA synthase|nr:o-succinylbenzoate--CoA ligase [Rhodococcus sp. 06-470-2]OZC64545.1 o-succinylbenzoate--CoA ligase [Rhodococcus sp. 06-469-3-2]OZC88020.1 o-succinylbenzoate--CoA ligase [Rhodococcus sp. 06-418-1B]OZD51179.1 o-succinylbenzoate--CoA ligase [Rhodococcus sp. 06-1477-1A]OZE32125.1 o-succinylbenzoate--CoA ligase [Rhodococcus sp. 05-2254-5]OZE58086.1 o-succinylbenzoate--CoA ligase [Rhodococcus sp. 05-2221-1B]OZE59548.1 o-succinylbenzoate--CoA ligase [Rhodococcus sp. 05-2254-1]OZE71618.1 o-succin
MMSAQSPAVAQTVVQLMSQIQRRPGHEVAAEDIVGQHRLTIAELVLSSNRLANAFIGLGLTPGSRVAYVAQNHVEYVVLEFALLKAGLVKVPLNHRFAPNELRRCIELADVRLVVADEASSAVLDEVLHDADILRVHIGPRDGWLNFAEIIAGGAPTSVQAATGPDDLYHIRFSSGSTGKPKGIAISHRGARAAILGNTWVMSSSGPVDRPRTLQVAPLVYAGGWSILPTLLCGGTNVFMDRFDAEQMLEVIVRRGITWMFAVPTMLRRMSTLTGLSALRESSLSCLMLAGEPAALPALEVVGQHTNALIQCWGQTEAPASTTLLSRTDMKHRELWASIGRPVPGVEFSVYADGVVLDSPEPGVDGELVIRTPSVASTLLGAEAEHAERSLPDGWWRTSDLGHFDDAGRIYIVGRASETIITGGTNIQPVEIERAFEEHAAVREAVVVGVPDAKWGETPAAYVHLSEPWESIGLELDQWLKTNLAGFKRPGHIFVSPDPIPRASGESKIARGDIKKTVQSWVADPSCVPANVTRVEK